MSDDHFNVIHGYASDLDRRPEYRTWEGMKRRCNNPNHPQYHRYGGRGIVYDSTWEKFENFLKDMGPRPTGYTLDRIDNNGNYCKENCKWSSAKEQQLNRNIKTTAHKDSKSGVVGVCFSTRDNVWLATGRYKGKTTILYRGKDFGTACNKRREWERLNSSI